VDNRPLYRPELICESISAPVFFVSIFANSAIAVLMLRRIFCNFASVYNLINSKRQHNGYNFG
ncbi:hypothetical protein, partial [uncultured Duncaniella sp.]|uniref:hypothetical protein n=1 Tax=uncultured Duncaniella sp. TaxID=2768039 RepID=UPI0026338CAE